ncbi:MAG: GGDEF domain-containing protein [Pseudomonadota bacterium]
MNFRSIKARILVLGVTLLVMGILVRNFVALPLFQEHVQELASSQQMSIATYVARDIDQRLASRLALIEQFAGELPATLAGQPQQLQRWIEVRQHANPLFGGGLLAIRPDGNALLADSSNAPARWSPEVAASDWFRAALLTDTAVIGRPLGEYLHGDPALVFAAPVRDGAGVVIAVLAGVAWLEAPGFLGPMQQTQPGTTGDFLLVSPAQRLLVASSDASMTLQPMPPPGADLLLDRAIAGLRGSAIEVNAKGVEELASIVAVPSTDWFLLARISTAEAFRPVEAVRNFMFKASAAFLLTLVVILLVVLPRILRPLTDTAHAIRDMADGKSKLAALPIANRDEVGELVKGFNFLVARLHKEEAARAASEARLKFLAHHDSLTGLYNRAMFEDRLEHALARAERDGTQIALLFCDLDGFKAINDQHGHHAGDAVLCQVARRLRKGRRQMDTVARLGGDEFVILLTGLQDVRTAANEVARQCLAAVSKPFEFSGKQLELGMSIGIAAHAGQAITVSYLIAQADIAMYQAKHQGKGNIFFMEKVSAIDPAASTVAMQPEP